MYGERGYSKRQKTREKRGVTLPQCLQANHHPQASSFPTSSHPEQFWADGGSGGGGRGMPGPTVGTGGAGVSASREVPPPRS